MKFLAVVKHEYKKVVLKWSFLIGTLLLPTLALVFTFVPMIIFSLKGEATRIAVYDPSGGYVTGAGTFESPSGALAGSTLTGTARFGFQSKYARGATVPTGNTQFKFRAGDFEFDSISYEWLVVAGARGQYKGTGVIKNQPGTFDFVLTTIDGELPGGGGLDKFRIKISSPGGVVYDNQTGAADSADPSTVIASGHIVIRK